MSTYSWQRHRDGELMRHDSHRRERQRSARRGEDARPASGGGVEDTWLEHGGNSGAASAMRHPAEISEIDGAEAQARTPRWRPLEPLLFLTAGGAGDVIDLAHPIMDRVRADARLKTQRLRRPTRQQVLTHPEPRDGIRESEIILGGASAGGNRRAADRLDVGRRLAPRVGQDRLIDDIEREGRWSLPLRDTDPDIVGRRMAWVPRHRPHDVDDLVIRQLWMREHVSHRRRAHAPSRITDRSLPGELHPPRVGVIQVALEPWTRGDG